MILFCKNKLYGVCQKRQKLQQAGFFIALLVNPALYFDLLPVKMFPGNVVWHMPCYAEGSEICILVLIYPPTTEPPFFIHVSIWSWVELTSKASSCFAIVDMSNLLPLTDTVSWICFSDYLASPGT